MVQLFPMTESDFQVYLQTAVSDYAQEHVRAGNWQPDEALQLAGQEFHKLLPDGPRSENQYMFTLMDESSGQKIGMIWFAINRNRPQPIAFIYDFIIYDAFRHQGYGLQALQAAEEKAHELGASSIGLHVFGHNHAARALYEKAGYQVAGVHMNKKLE